MTRKLTKTFVAILVLAGLVALGVAIDKPPKGASAVLATQGAVVGKISELNFYKFKATLQEQQLFNDRIEKEKVQIFTDTCKEAGITAPDITALMGLCDPDFVKREVRRKPPGSTAAVVPPTK